MKRAWNLVGLLACALILAVASGKLSFARITTASNTDAWCVGISGSEVCVDSSGNFIPTTDNDVTLGTSSLTWATVYTQDLTVSDDLTVTDDATVTSDLTVSGDGFIDQLGVSTNVVSSMDLHIEASAKSSSATVITAASSQTADLFRVRNSSLTGIYRIGKEGHVGYRQYTKANFDSLVADFVGAMAQCSDCTLTYSVCRATGASAAQWARDGSATVGCGSGE